MIKFFRLAIATIGFVALPFVAKASANSSAALSTGVAAPSIHVYESNCRIRPLEQTSGHVKECDVRVVTVAAKPVARRGVTTVQHIGSRVVHMAPLVVRAHKPAVLASR